MEILLHDEEVGYGLLFLVQGYYYYYLCLLRTPPPTSPHPLVLGLAIRPNANGCQVGKTKRYYILYSCLKEHTYILCSGNWNVSQCSMTTEHNLI